MIERVALFNLARGLVFKFAVDSLFVEPRDPRTGRDLEIFEPLLVASVAGQDCRVAVQFSLEDAHD
jgi:hypothetical protein